MDKGTVVHFEMRLFPVDAQPFAGIVGNTCNKDTHSLEQTLLRVPWWLIARMTIGNLQGTLLLYEWV